ncbi:type II toxin-antitoxin system VapB family antitoxin [Indioceanicola profundi]|uniref:type II toxin-antitoxin system VapB family antitoxin n=1 Tax=Indioceanicola profundi TaxID=2220096 RepID=UPI000E6ABBFD|nr:type II toxin-antitoxin system VapB family antitoxin [Indioceanicola profundi]
MRTNIDIDDELLAEAMKATGATTKKAAVDSALREVVLRHRRRQALDTLWGIGWDGDLNAIREDGGPRLPDADRDGLDRTGT